MNKKISYWKVDIKKKIRARKNLCKDLYIEYTGRFTILSICKARNFVRNKKKDFLMNLNSERFMFDLFFKYMAYIYEFLFK